MADPRIPAEGRRLPGGDLMNSEDAPETMGAPGDEEPEQEQETEPQQEAPAVNWLQLGREAYEFSTSYVDSNYRKKWEDAIRAFNNQHPMDSKYVSPAYAKRSNVYRPKTRSVIRKNESAAAAAFFSNLDTTDIQAEDQSNKAQVASAVVLKELLRYRLEKSIPWFQIVLGGIQDAQTVGTVAARPYWDTDADKPCVDLIPIENIRFDPGASWVDPVETSPYIIELIPMFVCDVKEMMDNGHWKKFGNGMIRQAAQTKADSTRLARNKDREDPQDGDGRSIADYEVVWIQRHIHRRKGQDWLFYLLGDVAMLTDVVPLEEEVFHGKRDYVIGCAILETHKVMPSGVPELSAGLQDTANEIVNQRLDNVKFVLNKKWFVKRGKNVDLASLVRNVPGGVTMADDPEADIKEVNWPDVTQSAYAEQDRVNADMDDLLGNFNPAAAQLTRKGNEPGKVMQLMAGAGSPLTEYLLRTYSETFVQKVLRHLVLLEQYYETDQVIIALAAKRGELFQKFGIDRVTDELLMQELTVRVNVGMGATDPNAKLQKFMFGVQGYQQIATVNLQSKTGLNMLAVWQEISGLMGHQDGTRFVQQDDPEKAQMAAQIQQMQQTLQQAGIKLKDKGDERQTKERIAHENNVTKIAIAHRDNAAKVTVQTLRDHNDNRRALAQFAAPLLMQEMSNAA